MIYGFRRASRGRAIVPCNSLDVTPIRQKPSFKIMLSDMRMKGVVRADPLSHLRLCVCGVRKISRAGIYIRQGDDCVCWLAATKKLLNLGAKLVSCRNSTVIHKHIEAGHLPREPSPKKCRQMRLECLLGSAFHQDSDLHDRAPRRPLLHNSSRE